MLLKEPNRSQRPTQVIIFLRGLPGLYRSHDRFSLLNSFDS